MVLHKIKDIQNFNTLYTSNCPFLIIHFMTNETYGNCSKFILMKIHKYINILKVISLNYNPYNSCNHFSKSRTCMILCMYMQSLASFTMNAPNKLWFLTTPCNNNRFWFATTLFSNNMYVLPKKKNQKKNCLKNYKLKTK